MQTRPGVWRWMKSDAVVGVRSIEGKALRFVGSQTDVTSLHVARDALHASREQFEALFSRAPVGMALIDEKAAFTSANNAICTFLGYSEADLISKKYWDFMLPHESRKIVDIIASIRNGDQVTHQSEHQFVAKDGRIKWGLANVSLDKDPMTGRDLYIAQIQDIDKIKEIEKIKSEFIATVSHELRTPLTSIKGAVELIHGMEMDRLSDNAARLLDVAKSNCGRLTLLVNDILDMGKISSGDLEINSTGKNLKLLIQNSIKNIAPYLLEHKVSIVSKLPQDDPIVWVDGNRVEQILTNLLSNAAKFSFSGGDIRVSFKLEDEFVKIIICDFGIGISKEFKSKIFEPFSQVDSSATRKKEGTGLGLHITKQLVEKMGGRIGFESVEDSHTIFWFTLPLKTDQSVIEKTSKNSTKK
jgi:PAS domain S-box-containing protein